MNKLTMFSFATIAVLTACSNDELVNVRSNDSNTIAFSTHVNKTTRATDITTANIGNLAGGFAVYGYTNALTDGSGVSTSYSTLFDAERVISSDGVNYSYENLQYWTEGAAYNFHAIAPYGAIVSQDAPMDVAHWAFTASGDYDEQAHIEFTNISDDLTACGEQDLVYAFRHIEDAQKVAAGSDNANYNAVSLDFSHLLSRVKFRFVGDPNNPISVDIKVTNIKLKGTSCSGSINIPNIANGKILAQSDRTSIENANWELSTTTHDLDYGDALTTFTNDYAESAHKYVIPNADAVSYKADFTFELTAALNNPTGEPENALYHLYEKAWEDFELPNIAMKKGYSYVYIIKVKTTGDPNNNNVIEPIVFSASVEEWKVSGDEGENNESQGNDWINISED